MDPVVLGVSVASLGTLVGSAGLLLRSRARLTGALGAAAGALGLGAAVATGGGETVLGGVLLAVAASVLGPVALMVYPVARWRHPAQLVSLALAAAAGLTATVFATLDPVGVVELIGLLQGCLFLAHTWWRIETSAGDERRQLLWLALAVSAPLVVYFFISFAADGNQDGGGALSSGATAVFALVAPALLAGVMWSDRVDVRGLVVGWVVTTAALTLVLSVYVLEVGLVTALGGRLDSLGAQGVLAALAALALQPTRTALRGVVDQLLFGERPDPLDAASSLAGRIGDDPLPAVQALREALVVPYTALLVDETTVATSGSPTEHVRTIDLGDDARLVVGLRPGDLGLTAGDHHVLAVVAPLIWLTLRAQRLTAEVQESRGRAVAALEEERRRLRRDLHDGLGPTLSGLAYTADAARNTLRDAPDDADELLRSLRADAVTAVSEVRRLVYGMRPPALDELGLARALRQWSSGLHAASGRALTVVVEAEDLPALAAGVETAAYRIAVEALTNAARHSGSERASLCLRVVDGALVVDVADDGARAGGQAGAWRAGVGIASMRERAAEAGGTLEAGEGRVRAVLPL